MVVVDVAQMCDDTPYAPGTSNTDATRNKHWLGTRERAAACTQFFPVHHASPKLRYNNNGIQQRLEYKQGEEEKKEAQLLWSSKTILLKKIENSYTLHPLPQNYAALHHRHRLRCIPLTVRAHNSRRRSKIKINKKSRNKLQLSGGEEEEEL